MHGQQNIKEESFHFYEMMWKNAVKRGGSQMKIWRMRIVCCITKTTNLFININQLDALNFYNKFISSLYMFRAHALIVRRAQIVLYSLWYHHTYRCDDTRCCIIQF